MGTRVNGVSLDAGASLSDDNPAALGSVAPGTAEAASRADHVHALPTIPALSSTTPAALGVAAVGVGTTSARADHVHDAPAAADITDAGATGVSLVQAASAAAARTTIGAAAEPTAGTDAARPAASTSILGRVYTATDTHVRYLCEPDGAGGARWVVQGRYGYEGRDTTCVALGATRGAASDTNTTASTVLSGAIRLALGTLPGGGTILISCTTAGGDGWQIRVGDDATSRGRLSSYRVGTGTDFAHLTGAEAAADDAPHTLAWAWDGVTVRYSWDGAAVATASHTSGAITDGTSQLMLGRNAGGVFAPDADLGAVKLWTTLVGDADLEAVALAGTTTGRLPDPAGATCILDWHAARYTEGVTLQACRRGTAQTLTWSAVPPMVVR